MDVDIIIKLGFFIGDFNQHIEQLHKDQFDGQNSGESFTIYIYRGQGMYRTDLEQMTKKQGWAHLI